MVIWKWQGGRLRTRAWCSVVELLLTMDAERLVPWLWEQGWSSGSSDWDLARYLLSQRLNTETSARSAELVLEAADLAAVQCGQYHSDQDRFRLRPKVIARFGPDRSSSLRSPGSIVSWFMEVCEGLQPPLEPVTLDWDHIDLIRRLRSVKGALVIVREVYGWLSDDERDQVAPWIAVAGWLP